MAGPNGSISPNTPFYVVQGGRHTFTLSPNIGYTVGVVTGCGGTLTGNSYVTGPITADCTINAAFNRLVIAVPHIVSTAIGGVVTGGSISPTSRSVLPGAVTTFAVTPNSGFRVASATGCGVAFTDTGSPQTEPLLVSTLAINAPCTVVANFAALPTFVVTATAGAGGRVTPTTVSVPQGLITNITVTPDAGFRLANVTGCGIVFIGSPSVTNPTTWPTAPITAACTVAATFASVPIVPPVVTTTPMIEFLHPALSYYFLTSRGNEIALLDRTPPFVRTGQSFLVYPSAVAGTQPITRFYFDRVAVNETRGSHFYTLVDAELNALLGLNPGNVAAPRLPFSEGIDSFAYRPAIEGVGGSCAPSLIPVYRVFRGNARFPDDPNHRFTTNAAIYNSFVALGWDGEGVKFCVPG